MDEERAEDTGHGEVLRSTLTLARPEREAGRTRPVRPAGRNGVGAAPLTGDLIRDVRRSRRWSQSRLAAVLCEISGCPTVTRESVSRWERGRRVPGPFWLPHIATALGMPLGELEKERGKPVYVIEVRDGELLTGIERKAAELGITNAAIVTLIGAADSFTVSTMPAADATKDIITSYGQPAEMTATGEIVDGKPHVHAVMAVEGDRAITGHLHEAHIGTWFARAYVIAAP